MFETVVIATDGSESAERSVRTAVDFASRFDATVHALYVVNADELERSPEEIREDLDSESKKPVTTPSHLPNKRRAKRAI